MRARDGDMRDEGLGLGGPGSELVGGLGQERRSMGLSGLWIGGGAVFGGGLVARSTAHNFRFDTGTVLIFTSSASYYLLSSLAASKLSGQF